MSIGFNALSISANAQRPEDEKEIGGGAWAFTIFLALALAIGLFFVVPVTLTSLIKGWLGLLAAVLARRGADPHRHLPRLPDAALAPARPAPRVRVPRRRAQGDRLTYEAGLPLTPENAQRFSRLHPRCGTSFLLVVMIVSIFIFAPLGLPAWYLLVLTRILGVPLITGISFELIKFAGRNRARGWVQLIIWPGMQLQKLTTREPSFEQLNVAIVALEAVLAVEDPRAASDDDLLGMEVVA